jgi:hypothetical protein
MAQSKILIDTNTYLRLAKTIHPLLFTPFGAEEYCLYILPELNHELDNRKLKTKFHWVDELPYIKNRQHFPQVSRKQKKAISDTFNFMWDYVQTELPGPSGIDTHYVAYALELNVPLVTDDQDMTQLAKVYEVKVMPTLQLLKLMLDSEHIDLKAVSSLFEYWKYLADIPANFLSDRRRFFPPLA